MSDQSDLIEQMLNSTKVIAIVGLSDKIFRASYQVAEYLCGFYTVIPVNPRLQSWLGLRCFASVNDIPDDLRVDMVDIFRRSEEIKGVVEGVVERNKRLSPDLKTRYIWMQLGLENQAAKDLAERNGLAVVMNACTQAEHARRA